MEIVRKVSALFIIGACLLLSPTILPAYGHEELPSLAPIVKKVMPAVVNIELYTRDPRPGEAASMRDRLPEDSPFRKKFFEKEKERPEWRSAVGSGFVIDPQGFIVSNNHVVAQDGFTVSAIRVVFSRGETYDATVIGKDLKTDIALLKIAPTGGKEFPSVRFGNSAAVEVGDWTMAIGNSLAVGHSVTLGIISAKGRPIPKETDEPSGRGITIVEYIQTDASINKGNSGGPLFNLLGEVIGINTVIASPTGGSVGIGFAIPSNHATLVVSEIKVHGRVRNGFVGFVPTLLSTESAETGIVVQSVTHGSPADIGGLKPRDKIISWNGREIKTYKDLKAEIAFLIVDSIIAVRVVRDGTEKELRFVVKERNE